MYLFEGDSADEVWLEATTLLLKPDIAQLQSSRGGNTREILHVAFSIRRPQQRWVDSRIPSINPAFAIAEVVWILRGRHDAEFLNFWNTQLPKYAGATPQYHGAYGYRLRHHFGIDQLERAYLALQKNPDTRQVVLQIWDAPVDFPDKTGTPVNPDIPCNVMSILKVRDEQLEWVQINRSNDLYKGVPYNFIQFTTIQEVLAGWLHLNMGTYIHFSDSLHLYASDIDQLNIREKIVHLNSDSLQFPKIESERYFGLLETKMDRLVASDLDKEELRNIANSTDLPTAFYNLLVITVAEAARRRGWREDAHKTSELCTNLLLHTLWNNWCARFERV